MTSIWFLCSDNHVSGPFTTVQVRDKVQAGLLAADTHIWWKGGREWLTLESWENDFEEIMQSLFPSEAKTIWYADIDGTAKGPLTGTELTHLLKPLKQLEQVRLWRFGMKTWTSVYEVTEAMELLGLSRREHERAPLMGQVFASRSNDDPKAFMLKTVSVSVAGVGLVGHHDLRSGDTISMTIKSHGLGANAYHVRGSVAYVTQSGYVGVVFEKIHAEMRVAIVEYVKHFDPASSAGSRAA